MDRFDASSTGYRYLHSARYNFTRLKIAYVHNKYSTSKNPRLIQGRLPNERLTSLRTYPHDEYLLRPGEYYDLASVPEPPPVVSPQPPQSEIPLGYECAPLSAGCATLSAASAAPSVGCPPLSTGCGCACHGESAEPQSTGDCAVVHEAPLAEREPLRPHRFWGLVRRRTLSGVNIPSPILESTSASPRVRETRPFDDPPFEGSSPPVVIKSSSGSPRSKKGNPRPLLRARLPSLSRLSSSESRPSHPDTRRSEGCQCLRCVRLRCGSAEAVWAQVINDVSLNAARVSTGALPRAPRSHFHLSADFTSAKCKSTPAIPAPLLEPFGESPKRSGSASPVGELMERPLLSSSLMSRPLADPVAVSPYSLVFSAYSDDEGWGGSKSHGDDKTARQLLTDITHKENRSASAQLESAFPRLVVSRGKSLDLSVASYSRGGVYVE